MKNFILQLVGIMLAFGVYGKAYKVSSPDEFNAAAAKVSAGDTIIIANGNYSGWGVVAATNGTPGKPVVIAAETEGQVIFSGDIYLPVFLLTGSYTTLKGITFLGCNVHKFKGEFDKVNSDLIQIRDASYCRITNCIFKKNMVLSQYMPIVVISGKSEYNRVDSCQFISNVDNQEVQVKITQDATPLYSLIDHNLFTNKVMVKGGNGGECVQIGQDCVLFGTNKSYSIVRDNRFINCGGDDEVISNKSSNNKYIHNYFENCNGELVMRGGHDCLLDSNVFNGGLGIRISGTHDTVTNNVIKGTKNGIRLMYGMASGRVEPGFYIAASDCLIENNTIENTQTAILIGDGKNEDWTGRFDTKRYPSRVLRDVAPFNNTFNNNIIRSSKRTIFHNEN